MHKARERQFVIQDRSALAALIREALEERFDGRQKEAERVLGIPQSGLSRLLRGKLGGMTVATFHSLRRLIPRRRWKEMEQAVITPSARELLDRYHEWESGHLKLRGGWESDGLVDGTAADFELAAQRQTLLGVIRDECSDLCANLDRRLTLAGHTPARIAIAYERITNPLLECEVSGFIERGWKEMDRKELRQFLKAAIKQELILTKRAPDVPRAQQVAVEWKRSIQDYTNRLEHWEEVAPVDPRALLIHDTRYVQERVERVKARKGSP